MEEKQSELREKLTEDNQATLVKKDRVTYADSVNQNSKIHLSSTSSMEREITKIIGTLESLIGRLDQQDKFYKMKFDMIDSQLVTNRNKNGGFN